jgi:DNA-binding CsgD family transcriptional regulator
VPADGVLRAAETLAVATLLDAVPDGPSGLVIEGEPGIGKTTLWAYGIDCAVERGFHVLTSRPASSESVLAFTCLADLLSTVDQELLGGLPTPQRRAVDRVLLRSGGDEATDRRAVAAALLSVVEGLAEQREVLLAVDDLQWVDAPSAHALEFVARRAAGRIGVLGAVRTSHDTAPVTWLGLRRPERMQRITLHPMNLGALHTVISERLDRHFPRPTLLRIFDTSGGNPFYALELARAITDDHVDRVNRLPTTLADVVQARLGQLDSATSDVLLAVACLGSPTLDVVAETVSTTPHVLVAMLEPLEAQGILMLDGAKIRFDHPLLGRGVYTRASAGERRAMHRRLADTVREPELRARHLALAATTADPATLRELDVAAELARKRGAPEASAELIELGVRLGGGSPERLIRLASYHFNAGDTDRARANLHRAIADLPAGGLRARAKYLLGVVRMFDDSFPEAADLLVDALAEVGDHPEGRVEMLVLLAFAQMNTGADAEAVRTARQAEAVAESCRLPRLLGQAVAMRVVLSFMHGAGVDEAALERSLSLEDHTVSVPIAIRPSTIGALLAAWTGNLEEASRDLAALRRRCADHGEDGELIFVDFHYALAAIWRADFDTAAETAADAAEIAPRLTGDVPRYIALITSALIAAFVGRVDEARRDAAESLAAGVRSGAANLSQWPVMAIGFLETSLGRHDEALEALEPLLKRLATEPQGTEIIAGWFLPDAIESMVAVGRVDEAEEWVDLLQDNGTRLDRAWMLAAAGRGRAMVLAARGDYRDAVVAAEEALVQHDRIPMPFDRARTRLLLGQLHRRLRRQEAAASALTEALEEFERLGTPLWAARAREHLARTNVGPRAQHSALTPSEQRVAELAATGMTNRDVAAALFISAKTVEANLSRVYRKLGIRSRAELGRRMSDPSA